jgi:hypothetical protein
VLSSVISTEQLQKRFFSAFTRGTLGKLWNLTPGEGWTQKVCRLKSNAVGT